MRKLLKEMRCKNQLVHSIKMYVVHVHVPCINNVHFVPFACFCFSFCCVFWLRTSATIARTPWFTITSQSKIKSQDAVSAWLHNMTFFKDLENPLTSLFTEDYFWIKKIKWKTSDRVNHLSTSGYLYSNQSMSTIGSASCERYCTICCSCLWYCETHDGRLCRFCSQCHT